MIAFAALTDITRIDAEFCQCLSIFGTLSQQSMTVEMKISHQRYFAVKLRESFAYLGHSSRGGFVVNGNSDQFGACTRQISYLVGGANRICGVGVGH